MQSDPHVPAVMCFACNSDGAREVLRLPRAGMKVMPLYHAVAGISSQLDACMLF